MQIRTAYGCCARERRTAQHARRQSHPGRKETAAAERRVTGRRILDLLEGDGVPPLDELDRMGGTDAAARLAERAVGHPRREVRLDRVKRANLDTLVAVDARVFDFSLAHPQQIAERKHGPARADVL